MASHLHTVLEQERRHITVMFVDIVQSSDLLKKLDVEEADALIGSLLARQIDICRKHGGIVNQVLLESGAIRNPVGFLVDPAIAMPSLIAVNVWKQFPFVAVMVLAGLQTIPQELYEAARVDGASFWAEVRHVMLPGLRDVLVGVSLLLTIWGLNGITLVYAIHVGKDAAPFILGQLGGLVVYTRNLYLIFRERTALREAAQR